LIHYFLISLAGLLIATYTDLKERMVYNKLTYALVIIGFALKAIESYQLNSLEPIQQSAIAGLIAFIAAYFLWKTGVWAGGDVKLVTAIAILNPINYAILAKQISLIQWPFTTTTLPIFPIELIIYSAFAVLPLGIAMSIGTIFKHAKVRTIVAAALREKILTLIGTGILIAGATIILAQLKQEAILVLPILIIAAILPMKIKQAITILIGATGLYFSAEKFAFNFFTTFVPLILIYTLWKIYSESKEYAFKEEIETQKIEEGMIPDCYIVENNGKAELIEGPSIKKVIKNIMNNRMENLLADFKPQGKIISSPNRAGGLTAQEAEKLKAMAQKGAAPKKIFVRKTLAFVPAILIAYLTLQLTGDVLWNIIL